METIIVDIINATLLNPKFWVGSWIVGVVGAAVGMLGYAIYMAYFKKDTDEEEATVQE